MKKYRYRVMLNGAKYFESNDILTADFYAFTLKALGRVEVIDTKRKAKK